MQKHCKRYLHTQITLSNVITTKNCKKLYSIYLTKIKKIAKRKIIKLIKRIEKKITKFVKINACIVANKVKKLAKLIDNMRVKIINDEIAYTVTKHEYKKRLKQEAQKEINIKEEEEKKKAEKKKEKKGKEKKKEEEEKKKKELNYFNLQMTKSLNMKYKSFYRPDAQLKRFQYINFHRRA